MENETNQQTNTESNNETNNNANQEGVTNEQSSQRIETSHDDNNQQQTSETTSGEQETGTGTTEESSTENNQANTETTSQTQNKQTNTQQKEKIIARPKDVVEKEYNQIVQDGVNEFKSFQNKFLAKAGRPIINQVNPQTGLTERVYAEYTAAEAFKYAIDRPNDPNAYDAFLACLSPIEVREFLGDQVNLNSRYNERITNLNNEKQTLGLQKQKEEDITQWDNYINTECKDNHAEAYLLNKMKDLSGFEKGKVDDFRRFFREALEFEKNQKELGKKTANTKNMMMGATPNTQKRNVSPNWTRAQIKGMSNDEYARVFDTPEKEQAMLSSLIGKR